MPTVEVHPASINKQNNLLPRHVAAPLWTTATTASPHPPAQGLDSEPWLPHDPFHNYGGPSAFGPGTDWLAYLMPMPSPHICRLDSLTLHHARRMKPVPIHLLVYNTSATLSLHRRLQPCYHTLRSPLQHRPLDQLLIHPTTLHQTLNRMIICSALPSTRPLPQPCRTPCNIPPPRHCHPLLQPHPAAPIQPLLARAAPEPVVAMRRSKRLAAFLVSSPIPVVRA
jgi:hypothetical protein